MFLRGVGKEKGSNARVTRSKFSWRFLSASLPLPSHPANRYCVVEIKGGGEGRGEVVSKVSFENLRLKYLVQSSFL